MIKRVLALGIVSLSVLSACTPEALLGAVAGSQVESAFYQALRTELQNKKLPKDQIDCIENNLKKTLKASDILAAGSAAGKAKIEQMSEAASKACIPGAGGAATPAS